MLAFLRFVPLALLSGPVGSMVIPINPTTDLPSARLVYQFPTGSFLENIATRPNGHLLLNLLSEPVLYTLDPTEKLPCPKPVYRFPNVNGTAGVAETNTPDVFAVIAGNYSLETRQGTKGSFSIWSVDLRGFLPIAHEISPVPDSCALNGLTVIPDSGNIILTSDSVLGGVRRTDPHTYKTTVAFKFKEFEPEPNFPLGINGINIYGDNLHFVNSAKKIYGNVAIKKDGYLKRGDEKVNVIAKNTAGRTYDDFTLDKQGAALLASHPDLIYKITLDGKQTIHSNSSAFSDPTSVVFGRGSWKERSTLYLSTGNKAGGQVVAVNYKPSDDLLTESRWSFAQQVLNRCGMIFGTAGGA